jgi:acyl-CoA reductase-like NAD-dependent aldehyde dehydrogenase
VGNTAGRFRYELPVPRRRKPVLSVNSNSSVRPTTPFGGFKQSGFGRELGVDTLELYLETKSVIVNTSPKPINPFGL